jgi:hypothetical protein
MADGQDSRFLLSADRCERRCFLADPSRADWRRFLIDTVLCPRASFEASSCSTLARSRAPRQ